MLILGRLVACIQLVCILRVDLVYGYYRQQRKLTEEIDWSYTGTLNQKNWGKKYSACNGAKQSPINIDEDLTQVNVNLKKLKFHGWEKETLEDTFIRNTGKTVEINLTNDYYVSGGGLDTVFKASKITFHWGKCNVSSDGSEHSLEGQKFPLEMQIYCYDADQFTNFEEAIKGNGKLRALSILFEIGLEDNPDYNPIINGVDSVSRFGKQAALEPFILLNLLPNATDKYYTYNGSLSTPPCSETVEWIVFKDTISISENQLAVFCEVLTMQQSGYVMLMDYLQNNFREQQYKFFGQVFSSYTGQEEIHEAVCSSEPENVQSDPKNYTSLLVTWERPRVVYDTTIERFAVFYQQLDGEDQTKHEFLTDGYQDLGAILNNLLPNTSYVLQIVAVCSNGLYGKYSDQVIVDMPLEDPEADLIPELNETEEYEDEVDEKETEVDEETAVIPSIDSANQMRKDFQVTTSSYSQERMGTKPYETKTNIYLTREEELHGKDVFKAVYYPTSPPVGEISEEEEESFMEPQTTTGIPPRLIDSTKGVEEEYIYLSSGTEPTRITTTGHSDEGFLLSPFKPHQESDDFWSSVLTTSSAQLVTEETSQEDTLPSGSPDINVHDVLSQGSIKYVSESVAPSSSDEPPKHTSSTDGNVWFRDATDLTTRSVDTADSRQLSQTSYTDAYVEGLKPATVSYSSSPVVSQDTSDADLELPHYSTFAFSSAELSPHSISSSSGEYGSASAASEVLSQTTQPVYNGEIPLQPSYSSEVFPLVTPLLFDSQMLDSTPATSDSDVTLHATPVFPSVDVSFEPTLSSYDDVPLLTFSSAFSSSKMFHRLYTVSQTFPQSATPAVASDKVSLHASLTLAEGDTLIQPSLAQYADVVSHQTTHAASETLIFGHNRTHIFSQPEPSSSDLNMHVLSTMSELPYALSGNVGSLQSFTVSYDSAEFVHDSVDVFRQDPLFSTYNNVLVHKPSYVISEADTLLQPTRSLSSDMDWSEAYSGSESLLPDTDTLMVLNISSSDSVDEITYESSGFSDVNKMLQKGDVVCGDERELQISSSLSEMASNAESKVIPELSTSVSNNDVIKQNTSLQESPLPVSSTKGILPVSLAFPTTKIFDHDISRLTENHVSVQPLHVTTPAFDDTLLKPMLSASSDQALSAPAYSKMLSSTQPYFYETSATLNNEALLQSSFQSSGDGTLLNTAAVVPSDPVLAESSRVHKDSSTFDQILHQMAPGSATTETMLHSTSAPSVADMLSNTFSKPTASLQGISVSYASEEYVSPSLFNSEDVQQVMPSLHSSDVSFQLTSLENTNAFPPQAANAVTTPFLTGDTLPHVATPADSHISSSVFERSEAASVSSSSTLGFDAVHMPAVVSDSDVSIHHTLPLPNVHISVMAVSPKSAIPVTLSRLLVPSRESSGLSPSIMSSTDLWPSVVEDDYDEYDDGFPVSNCISCTSHREAQDMIVEEQNTKVNNNKDQSNLIISSHSEKPEEEEKISTAASDGQINHAMDRHNYTSKPTLTASVIPEKHNDPTVLENHIQTASVPLQNTSESKSWAVFTSDEESGSGQGTSDSLNDNETSTDFSFPDLNERDAEGAVEAGNSELTPGSSQSSASSVTSDHSSVFNISEAEASNISHESRIGLAESLESEKKTVIPLVVVSALTFICLVILVGILIYWRKCFQTAHFYLEDNTSPRVISAPPAPVFPVSDDVGAIPIKHFPKHVADLHASNGFSEEFETLKEFYQEIQSCTVDLGITSDSSNHPDNKNKNRYINIVAYDHTRVKLAQLAEKDGKLTDYINANYVDGYNKPKAYIAAQGPLKSTAEDFWRMIWEHNVEVIVMITNLVEKGRRKCDQYWPAEGSEEYGNFLVTQKSVHVLAYYTVRNFTLRNTKIKKGSQKGRSSGRIVTQYHYTQWPDMGVPEYTLPVLTFVRKASHAKRHAVGPIVVHCSAGVGRTGTYIVLDSMLQQIQHEGTVNIFGFLKHIRTQRNYLVQTEEQYIFIHDALVEAILSKETEVLETHIHAYVNALLIPGPTGKTRLEKQFKLLSQSNTQQCDYSTALKQCNREKNRTSSIIPVERSRVGISSLSGEGTDYINASYIMGYYQSNEFIITQHPLLHTIKDFWRMIWDHNAQLIVMLPDSQNMAEDEFVYWPNKDEPINCESFKVTMIAEEQKCLSNEEKLIIQDFILEATQDDYVLEVRHFQCPKWPNPDSPISKTFELISIIKEETSNRDGPMIVHDEHGGVTAGTFCALTTLMHQLENENSVDVYQVAKMINLMRPGVFTDIEQYQFLYKAILSLVSTRQEENPSASMDSNGSALPDGNAAESLESLV
ncbi:receptor-type tyrosine-protein phosphatase zeta isoform X2 [Falco biarmicus]|uniref:receptor-type tyrosine-protein phosphatase zeta isoform X2 n=1 Tax=Falco peregrinus TaxID=8954 RepID=UPI00247B02D4|nr:receptor-type tyrosine-protein phosphatase zeta isoform X2 [Falco peregrinus]XP_056197606.1 receptor-type tyrosine-protein phosphatase zeta isoform X2 [Falco biarmicus]